MLPRPIPLFWRLFVPNATVLGVACVVLIVEPANGRVPALVGGLTTMLAVNLLLMRRAVTPLTRLTALMRRVDPLHPGERIPLLGPSSEVTVLVEAFNDMLDRLEAERRDSGLRALSEREGERRRLADELHDQIGQTLTAIALQVGRLLDRTPRELRDETIAVRQSILATIEDVRALARQLRPEALDALGLVPALTNLVERLAQQTGMRFERNLDRDLPPLGPDAELVAYRVAQEAITNAIRHAGATTIWISLHSTDGAVRLEICDDGRGITQSSGDGSGLRTMRERALTIGADLAIAARADHGTSVRLAVRTEQP
ncbi:MAG: histidine kinase [Actinomycetota bacterium]|nr:histidine kinase [Actinomycetota bacterium]